MSVKTKIQAHVEPETKDWFDQMAKLEGRSASNLAARIIADWLAVYGYRGNGKIKDERAISEKYQIDGDCRATYIGEVHDE